MTIAEQLATRTAERRATAAATWRAAVVAAATETATDREADPSKVEALTEAMFTLHREPKHFSADVGVYRQYLGYKGAVERLPTREQEEQEFQELKAWVEETDATLARLTAERRSRPVRQQQDSLARAMTRQHLANVMQDHPHLFTDAPPPEPTPPAGVAPPTMHPVEQLFPPTPPAPVPPAAVVEAASPAADHDAEFADKRARRQKGARPAKV